MSHYVNSYYSTDMDKFYAVYSILSDPAWLASHTQYGGVQNDRPKIRIGVQVLNNSLKLNLGYNPQKGYNWVKNISTIHDS